MLNSQKTSENERYKNWFLLKTHIRYVRNPRLYLEERATSDRLYRSSIFAMRRLLNDKPAIRVDPTNLKGIFNEPKPLPAY